MRAIGPPTLDPSESFYKCPGQRVKISVSFLCLEGKTGYPSSMPQRRFGPRQYAEQTNIDPSRFGHPQTDAPVAVRRKPLGTRQNPAMRDRTIPTAHEQAVEALLESALELAEQSQLYLKSQLQAVVQTLDTIVYEHDTVELPTTQDFYTLKLPPQTVQQELITGLFCSITNPTLTTGDTIDITNAWAQLGEAKINLNALLNSSGGSGGAIPGNFAFVLNADAKRELNIVASADWPVGCYVTFALFGTTVPATLAEVLH